MMGFSLLLPLVLLVPLGAAAPVPAAADALAPAPAAPTTQRYAVLIGAHEASGRETLRYAHADARRVGEVLAAFGGVPTERQTLLLEPTVQTVDGALIALRDALAARPPGANEVVLYYSGHADEAGFLLGDARYPYAHLKDALRDINVAVQIVVLDSCSSGSFTDDGGTRAKGATPVAPFIFNERDMVEGHAYFTSSSASEVSQESDRIGGSFFTHALLTGLRGAADADKDRRVTLDEAYRFAYAETVRKTTTSRHGLQHPSFDVDLRGQGDVALTSLKDTSARLDIPAGRKGHILVRDARDVLVAEFTTQGEAPVWIALEPGPHSIQVIDHIGVHEGHFHLMAGQAVPLPQMTLHDVEDVWASAKGGAIRDAITAHNQKVANINRYKREQLRYSTSSPALTLSIGAFYIYRGEENRIVGPDEFLTLVGKRELVEAHRTQESARLSAIVAGVSVTVVGLAGWGIGLLPLAPALVAQPFLVLPAVGLAVAGGAMMLGGTATTLGAVFWPWPTYTAEQSQEWTNTYNASLRSQLRLTLDDVESPRTKYTVPREKDAQ